MSDSKSGHVVLSLRVSPELKGWVRSRGGPKFAAAILETAMGQDTAYLEFLGSPDFARFAFAISALDRANARLYADSE